MTVLIGVLAGILYLLVDFGIFHLVCHSRSITEGYSLFLVLLWMSMSYGFTNFAWIWLWISKDRDLFFVVLPHFTVVVCLPAAFCDLQPCRYAADRHSAYNRGISRVYGSYLVSRIFGSDCVQSVAEGICRSYQSCLAACHRNFGSVRLGSGIAAWRHPLGRIYCMGG